MREEMFQIRLHKNGTYSFMLPDNPVNQWRLLSFTCRRFRCWWRSMNWVRDADALSSWLTCHIKWIYSSAVGCRQDNPKGLECRRRTAAWTATSCPVAHLSQETPLLDLESTINPVVSPWHARVAAVELHSTAITYVLLTRCCPCGGGWEPPLE